MAEAEYRYVLTRLRENGESIAVLGGEEEEQSASSVALSWVTVINCIYGRSRCR